MNRKHQKLQEGIQITTEDRFLIVRMNNKARLFPEGDVLELLAETLASFSESHSILCDLTGNNFIFHDIRDAIQVLERVGAHFIVSVSQQRELEDQLPADLPILRVSRNLPALDYQDVPTSMLDRESIRLTSENFAEVRHPQQLADVEWELAQKYWPEDSHLSFGERGSREFIGDEIASFQPGNPNWGAAAIICRRLIERAITSRTRNSLLTEFAFQVQNSKLLVTPYHAHALNSLETRSDLLVARPAVLAKKTGMLLSNELRALEELLQEPTVKEARIQDFLASHPEIFRALGYKNVYSQVVLQREDGTSLRPDFILEPLDNQWCDILDIKRPKANIVVGGRDRRTLAASIHEMAAQLREYSAYFEDEQLAKRMQNKLGIKCYRPRLIGVVGHDPSTRDERQLRRLMTCYEDLKILTFDQVLKVARSRLLI